MSIRIRMCFDERDFKESRGAILGLIKEDLGFLFTDVSRLMQRSFQKRLKGSLINLPQARVLLFVSRHEGICQVDLARLMVIHPTTIVDLIDQLTKVGYIERRPSPADRRVHQIFLTPNATPKLSAIRRAAKAMHTDVFRDLGKQEATAALSVIRKMHENLILQQ